MPNLIDKVVYWRLALWKLFNGSLVIGITIFIAGTANVDWVTMTGSQKMLIFLAAIVAMLKNADSFLSDTMNNLRQGKGLDGFDTAIINKPDGGTIVTTTPKSKPE